MAATRFSPLHWLWILLPWPLLWWAGSAAGPLGPWEERTRDWRVQWRGEQASAVTVYYVDVDSRSIADLGNQPWDRGYFAEVADALLRHGRAKAVGIDYVFSDNGVPELVDAARFAEGRWRLAAFLNQMPPPPVVVAASYAAPTFRDVNAQAQQRVFPLLGQDPASAQHPEMPEFRAGEIVLGAPHVGLIDTVDGETRRVHAFAQVGTQRWHHFAIELVRLYWGLPREGVEVSGDSIRFRRPEDGRVLAEVPLERGQDLRVNWFSRWLSEQNPRVSFSLALMCARLMESGTPEERAVASEFFARFDQSVVLIGPVDPLLHDLAVTPWDATAVPQVGVHGNLVKMILNQRYVQVLPLWVEGAVTLSLAWLVAWLATGPGSRRGVARLGAVARVGLYVVASVAAFVWGGWLWPWLAPLGATLTTGFVAVGWQLVTEERQKRRIQGLFGTYLSPALVSHMIESGEQPRLGGHEVEITAYFSDIESFSTLAEALTPTQLVELMNEYLTACTDILTAEGGTLDKYIGDGIVAMFGSPVAMPDHAARACRAAWRIQTRLEELREKWRAEGGKWPSQVSNLRMRIGLATGRAVVGNMGSQTRFNYTMTGDTVNLASRLESAGKVYGTGLLVAEATREAAEKADPTLRFQFVDTVQVIGRQQPEGISTLLGVGLTVAPEVLARATIYETAWKAYARGAWAEAAATLEQGAEESGPARVLRERLRVLQQKGVPPGWTGVWALEHK